MSQQNPLIGHVRRDKRFFTAKNQEVVASYICKHVNEKSLVGIEEETKEEVSFNLETGQSSCGETVVYIGHVPQLYDKLLSDARFWVQSLPPVKARL